MIKINKSQTQGVNQQKVTNSSQEDSIVSQHDLYDNVYWGQAVCFKSKATIKS